MFRSNQIHYIKGEIPASAVAGATFPISKDFELGEDLETGSDNVSIILKTSNSSQIERMVISATGGIATIIKRGLDKSEIKTEVPELRKTWSEGTIFAVTALASDLYDVDTAIAAVFASKMDTVGGLGQDYGANKVKEIDPTTGDEVLRNLTVGTSIGDTELIRSIDATTRGVKETPFSQLKNQLASVSKYTHTVSLGDPVGTNNIADLVQYEGITVVGSDSMTAPMAVTFGSGGQIGASWTPTTLTGTITFPVLRYIENANFNVYSYNDAGGTFTKTVEYTVNGTTWTTAVNGAVGTNVLGLRMKVIQAPTAWGPGSPTLSIGALRVFGRLIPTSVPSAMAIVNKIEYPFTLSGATAGSIIGLGVRLYNPFPTPITITKLSNPNNSTSASAKYQIFNDSGTLINEYAVAVGTKTITTNVDIPAFSTVRIVANDTNNFGGYSSIAHSSSYATCRLITTGINNGVIDQANHWFFNSIEIDYKGKAYKTRAVNTIEADFGVFAGFVIGPKTEADTVTLDPSDMTPVSGFSGLSQSTKYYLGGIYGSISTTASLINRQVGYTAKRTDAIIQYNGSYLAGTMLSR